MAPIKFFTLAGLLLICTSLTVVSKQIHSEALQIGSNAVDRKCENLRREIFQMLQQVNEKEVGLLFPKEVLRVWLQHVIPQNCSNQHNSTDSKRWFSGSDNRLHLQAKREFKVNKDMSSSHKKNVKQEKYDIKMYIPEEKQTFLEEHPNTFHDRQGSFRLDVENSINNGAKITSLRQFYNKISRAHTFSHIPEQLKETNEFLNTRGETWRQNQDYRKDDVTVKKFSNHTYKGSNKNEPIEGRRVEEMKGKEKIEGMKQMDAAERKLVLMKNKISRKKRFLFGEAAETPPMPSLFSIMMGTAVDPNTGRRIEFGGDIMRDMMVNTFTSFLPPGAQPPPGKEPGELVQIMAPVWYFSQYQRAMQPQTKVYPKTIEQRRNPQGYYGETMQGKKR